MGQGAGEQLVQDDAHRRDADAQRAGQADGVLQALAVAGGVVVGRQRQHALADADPHVEGEALDLQNDADGRQGQIAVAHHQLVQDDIVHVKEEGGDGRRHAHRKDGRDALPRGKPDAGVEGDHRALAHPGQHHEEVAAGDAVGQAGGDARAQHLQPVGQQDEHEQRVEGDVQQPAQDDAEAGLLRAAHAAQKVGQHIGQHRRHAARHDDAGRVLPGVLVGVLARAQRRQDGPHAAAHDQGEQRGDGRPQVQRKGRHTAGLVLAALAQQPRDEGAAPDARQARQTQRDVEDGQDEGGPRHHVGVVGLADIEGVGHVVDQDDQLAGHRRQDHDPQRGGDG